MDAETARKNELGENSHQAYKERQHARVKARLSGAEPESAPPILVDEDDEDDDD